MDITARLHASSSTTDQRSGANLEAYELQAETSRHENLIPVITKFESWSVKTPWAEGGEGDEGWAAAWWVWGKEAACEVMGSEMGIGVDMDQIPMAELSRKQREGMWEIGAGKMCRMWHSHFSASGWFRLGHMLRILALLSEYFAWSFEDTRLGKTNGKCVCGEEIWIFDPCLLSSYMLLLGGGFPPLKGNNIQVLQKGLTLKRLIL